MKALVFNGPGKKTWTEVPDPQIVDPRDAIIRVDAVTICGTDLHILKGDVPEVEQGRILGHEAVGTIVEIGSGVRNLTVGIRSWSRAFQPVAGAVTAGPAATASAVAAAAGSWGT